MSGRTGKDIGKRVIGDEGSSAGRERQSPATARQDVNKVTSTHASKQPRTPPVPPRDIKAILVSPPDSACETNISTPNVEERTCAPRVSFAAKPSCFPEQPPVKDLPRRRSRKSSSSSSSKRRKDTQDCASETITKEDGGDERVPESDPQSSTRDSSSRSNTKEEKKPSQSRRSSHHRSNARRRSHADPRDPEIKRSDQGETRDGSNKHADLDHHTSSEGTDTVKREDFDLKEPPVGSEEKRLEYQLDGEYDEAAKQIEKEKRRHRQKRRLRNRAMLCFCVLLCFLSTLGVLVFVIMRGDAFTNFLPSGQSPNNQKSPDSIAPTPEKCDAISKGLHGSSEVDQTGSLGILNQFQIRVEVQVDDQQKESDATFLSLLVSTLQELVMPILAGCEPATHRRGRRMQTINPWHQYMISNCLVVDAQFDLSTLASNAPQASKYCVNVLVDIWTQEEVDDRSLSSIVWKAFEGFMDTPGLPKGFPIVTSTVLSVDFSPKAQDSKEVTPFPTLEPTPRPSHSPSLLPSLSPSHLPTAEPTLRPSMNPSGSPTERPTPSPSKATSNPTIYTEPSSSPSATPIKNLMTTFYVIGDLPYNNYQRTRLIKHVNEVPSDAEFLVHVGDIRNADHKTNCLVSEFEDVANILKQSRVPVLLVPGDNEYNDCPNLDESWGDWLAVFGDLEKNWRLPFNLRRDPQRQENFYFVYKRVLYIGLNIVGGDRHNFVEWQTRLSHQFGWMKDLFEAHVTNDSSDASSVVIFAHADPRLIHSAFFVPLQYYIRDTLKNEIPIIYINGDKHYFQFDTEWYGQESLHRIMVEGGSMEPPLQMKLSVPNVSDHGVLRVEDVYTFDRQL